LCSASLCLSITYLVISIFLCSASEFWINLCLCIAQLNSETFALIFFLQSAGPAFPIQSEIYETLTRPSPSTSAPSKLTFC
jgi:hypothetical protein